MTLESADPGPVVDVAGLPRFAFGRRSALFWGVLVFIAIETTALAIMFTSYLYVRGNFDTWPPSMRISPWPGLVTTALLLASCVPMHLSLGPCRRFDVKRARRWMLIAVVLGFLACGARAWEIASLPFLWSENAYASVVHMTYGMHTVELVSSVLESLVMVGVFYRGPLEEKHFEDGEVTGIFWYFANLVWIPFALLFYLDGALR